MPGVDALQNHAFGKSLEILLAVRPDQPQKAQRDNVYPDNEDESHRPYAAQLPLEGGRLGFLVLSKRLHVAISNFAQCKRAVRYYVRTAPFYTVCESSALSAPPPVPAERASSPAVLAWPTEASPTDCRPCRNAWRIGLRS